MQNVAITGSRGRAARVALTVTDASRARSVGRIATVVGAVAIVALLIGWVVAASLGLGAADIPGVGPDRPPAPVLVRLHTPAA
jgi:hypothetical protein